MALQYLEFDLYDHAMTTTTMDANLNGSVPPFQDVHNRDYSGSGCGSHGGGPDNDGHVHGGSGLEPDGDRHHRRWWRPMKVILKTRQ